MDVFDVLAAISKKKTSYMHSGIKGNEALARAELDVSNEYHISLSDVKRLVEGNSGQRRSVP